MNVVQQYQAYQNNQAKTASPERLVTMLYDGALKFITLGEEGIREKDIEKSHINFVKAQNIILELRENLDMSVGEVAQGLYDLYDFMYNHLVEANLEKDTKLAQEVYALLEDLRSTWVIATKQK